tara:strand:- start:577 stop:912 length:336 start_codon:yes stop_codon:yes gene_type:complete
MAAMIASVASATGSKVSVFFSMNSMAYFVKGKDECPPSEGEFGPLLSQQGVPPFKQLFQQSVEFGDAKLLPCSMVMDLLKISEDDLEPGFGPPTGLASFLSEAEDGQLITL